MILFNITSRLISYLPNRHVVEHTAIQLNFFYLPVKLHISDVIRVLMVTDKLSTTVRTKYTIKYF